MCVIDDKINNAKQVLKELMEFLPIRGIKNKTKWLIKELEEYQQYAAFVKNKQDDVTTE